MILRCPINEQILEEEIGIDKIGYRVRILNKLKSGMFALKIESKIFIEKLQSYKVNITKGHKKFAADECKCCIY